MNEPILDIGGLDKAPTDRGLTVKKRGDFIVINVGQNDLYAAIELTAEERKNLRDALAPDTLEERAAESIDTIFDIVNKMSGGEDVVLQALDEAMRRQHRTLVQGFWRVIAKVIKIYSENKHFDLRNEDSVRWAKEVAKTESFMAFI